MDLVEIKRGIAMCDSLEVAETFGKNHRDVLESVRSIIESISTAEFSALFNYTTYRASNGKSNPMYLMTKDGFTLLAMGYTGKDAMEWKLKYLELFSSYTSILEEKKNG